jgi:hypothetical protein
MYNDNKCIIRTTKAQSGGCHEAYDFYMMGTQMLYTLSFEQKIKQTDKIFINVCKKALRK